MAIQTTHTFELEAGELVFIGEVEYPSGTYTENEPVELPAGLETDFKRIISLLKNFNDTYDGLTRFEVKLKE